MNRVGLQEYFEKILEFRFGAFDKIIESRFTAMEKAVQLATKIEGDLQRERAAEIQRRLEGLNNEAQRIAADKVTYLSKDSHNGDMKEIRAMIEAQNGRLQSLEKVSTIAVFLAVAIPIAIQLIIAVSNWIGKP